MSPSVLPRTSTALSARVAVVLTTLALLLVGLPFAAGTASAATNQRIELRVLVLDGGGASERAIAAQLAREGVPTTRVDLAAAGRQQITAAFLENAAASTAHFQGVVLPSTAPQQLSPDELATLATYERTYGVREVAANVFPGTEVSPAFRGGVGGPLDGGRVTPTAAARADGFGYLNGTAFPIDDFAAGTTEAFGTLGAAPVLSPGETFTPLLNATVGANSGWLAGVYTRDGREQLLVSAAYNENQQWFGQFGHGVVSWLTRGISLGLQRNFFAVQVDDVFLADSRWSTDANCTPGDGCVDPATTTPDIRMTSADVTSLVAWQNANDFKLDMVYNAGGSVLAASQTGGTDQLTTAFTAAQAQFPWINHTYSHPYLGCIQIAPTVVGQTWRCATSATDGPRQDPDIPAQLGPDGVYYASQAFLTQQIRDNAAWGAARFTDVDSTELVTGEHSGLRTLPQQPNDNPFLAAALSASGIRVTASDNSRESTSRTLGSTVTMPRYPMNIYYNAGSYQDQIDEYNWYYAPRSAGGGGICEANSATSTCMPAALPAATQQEAKASYDGYLKPLEVRNALSRVLSNDPRPFYAHQSNLTEDKLLLPVVEGVLSQYRATHTAATPLVRTDLTAQAQVLARQTAWTAAQSSAPVGYVDATGVHVPAVSGVAVPVTVPASATGAGLSSYGGEKSAWTTAASTITLATPLGGYGGSAAPVAPAAPTVGTPVAGDGSVQVTWTAPTDLGGSAIRTYTVTAYSGDTTTVVGTATAAGSDTTATVSGLTNGVPVTITVTATNGAGTSLASVRSVPVTPLAAATVPGPVPSVYAVPTVGGVTASWTAPTTDGGSPITGYRLTATAAGASTSVTTTSAEPRNAVLTGLSAGTGYQVTVVALNQVGAGAPSPAAPVTPLAASNLAGAPTGVTAVAGDGQATVSWTPPADAGQGGITGYVVVTYEANGTYVRDQYVPGSPGRAVAVQLINGTPYKFAVSAVTNDRGAFSATSEVVTPRATAGAPAAPGLSSVVVTSGQARVGWTAPTDDGGSPVTGYTVTVYAGTTSTVVATATAAAGDRAATVNGLTDGTSYTVAVTATNAAGTSPSSTRSATVTPVGLPGAPTLTSAVAGDQAVTLGWTAPSSTGGSPVSAYEVRLFTGSTLVSTTRVSGSAAGTTLSGLTVGTAYTADVAAVNVVGTGAVSARSAAVVPFRLAAPAAPAAPTVTPAPSSLTVGWQPPAANGGPAVTGYTVTVYAGTTTTVVSRTPVTGATSVVVGGLVNGTAYTVTVAATNSVGTGPASARSALVRPAPRAPGAPTITGITAGAQALTVSWNPPADNGGATVTSWIVTVYAGTSGTVVKTDLASAGDRSEQVTGLTAGATYTVTVTARNSVGYGTPSDRSAPVTPVSLFSTPSAPTITSVTAGPGSVSVAWTPPVTTGLFGTSGYTITVYSGTGTTVARTVTAGSSARTATVTGLTRGQTYTVTVTPRSLLGAGTASARSAPVTAL